MTWHTNMTGGPSDRPQQPAPLDLAAIRARADAATELPLTYSDAILADVRRMANEIERHRTLERAIIDSRLDPAGELVRADRIAGEAIIRAHLLEGEVERLSRIITEAKERLRAASIPLGMTEAQFHAQTIRDSYRILNGGTNE